MGSKVYIIIINVNSLLDTMQCIQSIYKNDYKDFQIILIENSRNPDSVKKLISELENSTNWIDGVPFSYKHHFRTDIEEKKNVIISQSEYSNQNPIIIIENSEVSGFSENNNLGIKYAQIQNDFVFIWILNNDTLIHKNALTELINTASKNDKIGLVGSVLVYNHARQKIQCVGGAKYYFTLGFGRGFKKNFHLDVINTLDSAKVSNKLTSISGASFFIRKQVLDSVGLMDESYFMYGDDLDFTYRIFNAGWEKAVSLTSIVYHKHNVSTKKKSQSFYYHHNSLSSIIFARKHLNNFYLFSSAVMIVLNTFRKTRNLENIKATIRGIKKGLMIKLI